LTRGFSPPSLPINTTLKLFAPILNYDNNRCFWVVLRTPPSRVLVTVGDDPAEHHLAIPLLFSGRPRQRLTGPAV
jgi:hypothetical protein